MKRKRLGSMARLEKEIHLKRLRAAEIERRLDYNVEHLRDNFRGMALRSVLGGRSSGREMAGEFTMRLIESEKLQDNLLLFVDKITDRLARAIRRSKGRRSEEGAEEG
jgi:ribosome-associated translation inhibitor RaiA